MTEFGGLDGVQGEVLGPIPSEDGEAAQVVVTFNFGANGWNDMPAAADSLRELAGPGASTGGGEGLDV